MRLEALEKEADLYEGEGYCYLHAEQTPNNPVTLIVNGDPLCLTDVIYFASIDLATELNKSPVDVWKTFIKVFKKRGVPKSEQF